jgi:hypothetical protein
MRLTNRVDRLAAVCISLLATVPAVAWSAPAAATTTAAVGSATPVAAGGYARYSGSGPLNSHYTYDSADSAPGAVTVSSLATGLYTIDFADLGGIGSSAIVQVSSYQTSDICAQGDWGAAGRSFFTQVDCWVLATGASVNAGFSLVVSRPGIVRKGIFDYSFVYEYTRSSALTQFQYNSSRRKNSVRLLGRGRYRVLLGGPRTTGTHGVVKLTTIDNNFVNCELEGWTGSAKGELVYVNCFADHHLADDSQFLVTYTTQRDLTGMNHQVVANAFADSRAARYQPAVQYDSTRPARVTVVHLATGRYAVRLTGSGGDSAAWGGNAQVNAVSSSGRYCEIGSWRSGPPDVRVSCRTQAGHLVNTPFTIEWMVP